MKKVLLVSGCSFTDKNFISDYYPKLDTSWPKWPELLAKKLDMDCINLGKMGSGNEYIYTSLLDQIMKMNPSDIGLIIPAWTGAGRKDWKVKGKWKNVELMPYSAYVATNGDIDWRIERSMTYYYSLQEICKNNNLPLKQFQMLPIFRGYDWDPIKEIHEDGRKNFRKKHLQTIYNNSFFNKIDDSFIGWPTESSLGGFSIKMNALGAFTEESYEWTISKRDNHPNAKGQEKIMEFIYDRLG